MIFRVYCVALVAALALSAGPVSAHSVKVGGLELTDLWTRATPPNAATGGGYLTIENKGAEADRLVGAASPLAGLGELHEMKVTGGTMTMRPLGDGIAIPAGATVTLAPGGMHVMFMNLNAAFTEGGKVPVELTFEKAGTVETFLHVFAIGAGGPEGDHQHGAAEQGAAQ